MIFRHWIEEIQRIDYYFFDDLKKCTHNYIEDGLNLSSPYHREHDGNVWGHTQDVYQKSRELYPDDEILQLACLLHDIGKPFCRENNEEKQKTSFHSHESFGVAKATEILNRLSISHNDKIRVLKLIQRHADSYKLSLKKLKSYYDKEDFEDLMKIRWCDSTGRECDDMDEVIEQMKDIESKSGEFVNHFDFYKEGLPECTILIGPPCSGKSTWIKENKPKHVLSRDNILTDMYVDMPYNEAWEYSDQKMIDEILQRNRKYFISEKLDFTIDMTNMNIKSRNKMIHDMKGKFNLKAVVFIAAYDELIKRNKKREGKVLAPHVIPSMCKRWQLPVPGEGFYDVEYIFN